MVLESLEISILFLKASLLMNFFRLIKHIAPLLNKPAERFNWVLETDKIMSKVWRFSVVFKDTLKRGG